MKHLDDVLSTQILDKARVQLVFKLSYRTITSSFRYEKVDYEKLNNDYHVIVNPYSFSYKLINYILISYVFGYYTNWMSEFIVPIYEWALIMEQIKGKPKQKCVNHEVAKGEAGKGTHFLLKDIMQFKQFKKYQTLVNLFDESWTNAAVTGMILSLYNGNYLLEDILYNTKICNLHMHSAVKTLKLIHNYIRTTGHYGNKLLNYYEYNMGQYMDTLCNRDNYNLDVDAEILMRMNLIRQSYIIHNIDFGGQRMDNEVYMSILKYFKSAVNKKPRITHGGFAQFWSNRLTWVTGGSAAGFKNEIFFNGEKLYTTRMGKRLALEAISDEDVVKLFDLVTPVTFSRSAIKYECGKNRALWNSVVLMYVLHSYVLSFIEPYLDFGDWNSGYFSPLKTVSVEMERLTYVKHSNNYDCVLNMWDFADFNYSHSHLRMCDVNNAIYNATYKKLTTQVRCELRRAIDVMNASIMNTFMNNQNTGLCALVLRSLLTGTRGTAFYNTIFNYGYTTVCSKMVKEELGYDGVLQYTGQGDDVWLVLTDCLFSQALQVKFNLCGFAGQPTKQLEGFREGEYLRRRYSDGKVTQYINRGIASLVCGEYKEKVETFDIYMKYENWLQQKELLYKRGVLFVMEDWFDRLYINKKCTLIRTDKQGNSERIKVDTSYFNTSTLYGGAGYNVYLGGNGSTVKRPELGKQRKYAKLLSGVATRSYATKLFRLLEDGQVASNIAVSTLWDVTIKHAPPQILRILLDNYIDKLIHWHFTLKPVAAVKWQPSETEALDVMYMYERLLQQIKLNEEYDMNVLYGGNGALIKLAVLHGFIGIDAFSRWLYEHNFDYEGLLNKLYKSQEHWDVLHNVIIRTIRIIGSANNLSSKLRFYLLAGKIRYDKNAWLQRNCNSYVLSIIYELITIYLNGKLINSGQKIGLADYVNKHRCILDGIALYLKSNNKETSMYACNAYY